MAAGDDMTAGKSKQSRGEKKARKIMSKLGLKQVGPLVNLTGRSITSSEAIPSIVVVFFTYFWGTIIWPLDVSSELGTVSHAIRYLGT